MRPVRVEGRGPKGQASVESGGLVAEFLVDQSLAGEAEFRAHEVLEGGAHQDELGARADVDAAWLLRSRHGGVQQAAVSLTVLDAELGVEQRVAAVVRHAVGVLVVVLKGFQAGAQGEGNLVAQGVLDFPVGGDAVGFIVGGHAVAAVQRAPIGVAQPFLGALEGEARHLPPTSGVQRLAAAKKPDVELGLLLASVEGLSRRVVAVGAGEGDAEGRRNPIRVVAVEQVGVGPGGHGADVVAVGQLPVAGEGEADHLLAVHPRLVGLGRSVVVQGPDVVAVVAVEGEQIEAVLRTLARAPAQLGPSSQLVEAGEIVAAEGLVAKVAVADAALNGDAALQGLSQGAAQDAADVVGAPVARTGA